MERFLTPGFIILGAPKAGTTSLWRLVSQHPDIFPCATKEPGFFIRDEIYARGLDWYQSLFSECAEHQIAGEATTEYSQTRTFPDVVARIAEHLPEVKLIFMMRHPFETLESRWRQSLANRDFIPRSFPEAIRRYPPLLENALHGQTIRDYLEYFPRKNLLLLLFEDFKIDPSATCAEVYSFIGVDPAFKPVDHDRVWNAGADKDIDSLWVAILRRIPATGALRDMLPIGLRRMLRTVTRRKPYRAIWTKEIFQLIQPQISGDAALALELAGKNHEYWDLSDTWLSKRLDSLNDNSR
jgi:hypothetical protein